MREGIRAQKPFHVALIDKMMPGMSGEELGCRIRKDTKLEGTKLVMFTAWAEKGDANMDLKDLTVEHARPCKPTK